MSRSPENAMKLSGAGGLLAEAGSKLSSQDFDAYQLTSLGLWAGAVVLGVVYSTIEFIRFKSMVLDGYGKAENEKPLSLMIQVSKAIAEGATAFLMEEFIWLSVYIVVAMLIIFLTHFFLLENHALPLALSTTIAFLIGALASALSAFLSMKVAVMANVRTAHACWIDIGDGFAVSIRGGSIMGVLLVSMGLLAFGATWFGITYLTDFEAKQTFEALTGFGLGASSIALFARVGGGIYTKAADVGADLAGKNEYGMDEDDPRNPACIADNVGDNVGDIAGMGADLFGSFSEATCAALVVLSQGTAITDSLDAVYLFPLVLSACGLIVSIITIILVGFVYRVKDYDSVEFALKLYMLISGGIMIGVSALLCFLLNEDSIILGEKTITAWILFGTISIGLVSGVVIGLVTEYFTSHSYRPVREIAESQKVAAATGIIFGLSVGYYSFAIPGLLIAVTAYAASQWAGLYGLALASLGMLSTLGVSLAIDAYGPISDNAGGIAEMSGLGADVRARTDALDAAGNTTAAIGKGFAIGSAALVSLSLFGAFCSRANLVRGDVSLLDMDVIAGILCGAVMASVFSALTMKSVGTAAQQMVSECMRQFPEIVAGRAEPDYTRCVAISTRASLREMVAPGLLVLLCPLILGLISKKAVAGLLIGGFTLGVANAVSLSNSGGAWDNAKKYIESGALGPEHKKGSATHKNAVVGDTVGDPCKDTTGPSLNILVKLSAITAVVAAGFGKSS
jgi:H+-translocating diphosphatase